jgi:hypothetical protein
VSELLPPPTILDDALADYSKGEVNVNNTAVAEEGGPSRDYAPYPYDQLTGTGPFPLDVDYTKREYHLTDSVFFTRFGCTKTEYTRLSKWQRDKKKKDLQLF